MRSDNNFTPSNNTFPQCNNDLINTKLEDQMAIVKGIVSTIHSIRKNNKLKVRHPLEKCTLYSPQSLTNILPFKDIILKETNIKDLEITDTNQILQYKVKPNYKILGQKYKDKMKDIATDISNMSEMQINKLHNGETVSLICGIPIAKEDCLFEIAKKDDTCVGNFENITIILDTTVTKDLEQEGISNDFINFVQNYRKENSFNVKDKMNIQYYCESDKICAAIEVFKNTICEDLLCQDIMRVYKKDKLTEYNFNETTIQISIERIKV